MFVELADVEERLPRPLFDEERPRVETLIKDAEARVRVAFSRRGRDLDRELETRAGDWLKPTVEWVLIDMVAAAVLVGMNAGVRAVSSTTGPQSDSLTYADVGAVSFGGVRLTNEHLRELGLVAGLPVFCAPPPMRWPEVY
ncbi:hypothetical protein C1Y63_10570 [Corynebacterium sp. 13CS0277]|uniref:Gp19/Gp15/Gp42 family protein n=1 Tax=Corynebacterium sp. 13CS0277 TaxID=2071994 RepID=UPI000D024E73|nr:Gp19/Gp15/Gp42 family protein [Corynebacterium sp. 13CS0277]PRQ10629.1 hypothetical protein C1Y63_10570 [Corynebacterium sp. 13CS0277]